MFEAPSRTLFLGPVLLRMRLLWSAEENLSNLDCAALRAMTGPKGESAVMLFLVFMQLLKLCGLIHDFDFCFSLLHPLP